MHEIEANKIIGIIGILPAHPGDTTLKHLIDAWKVTLRWYRSRWRDDPRTVTTMWCAAHVARDSYFDDLVCGSCFINYRRWRLCLQFVDFSSSKLCELTHLWEPTMCRRRFILSFHRGFVVHMAGRVQHLLLAQHPYCRLDESLTRKRQRHRYFTRLIFMQGANRFEYNGKIIAN